MLPLNSNYEEESALAIQNGAYQSAIIRIHDPSNPTTTFLAEFDNSSIVMGSLQVTKSCVSGSELELGATVSDELRVTLKSASISSLNLVGKPISLDVAWGYETNATEHIYPFSGIVTEVTRRQQNVYEIVALDYLSVFDKPYNPSDLHSFTFPVNILSFVGNIIGSIGAPYGLQLATTMAVSFLNTSELIKEIPTDQGYTYRQILKWCAQIMGVNLRIYSYGVYYNGQFTSASYVYAYLWTECSLDTSAYDGYLSVDSSKAYNIDLDDADYQYDGVDIVFGDSVLYANPALNGYPTIPIRNNPLMAQKYADNEYDEGTGTWSWDNIAFNINARVVDDFGSAIHNCGVITSVSMWYLEPGDIVRVYQNNTGYNLLITSITHRLNGNTRMSGVGVTQEQYDNGTIPAFNIEQEAQLLADFQQICYTKGDVYTGLLFGCGYVTSTKKSLYLTFPTPKFVSADQKVNISEIKLHIFEPAGRIIESNGYDATSYVVTTGGYPMPIGASLTVRLDKAAGWDVTNNNEPLNGYVNITFNIK